MSQGNQSWQYGVRPSDGEYGCTKQDAQGNYICESTIRRDETALFTGEPGGVHCHLHVWPNELISTGDAAPAAKPHTEICPTCNQPKPCTSGAV